jgi:nucleotide-binding universal stress UspA family protein
VVPFGDSLSNWVVLEWCRERLAPGSHVVAVRCVAPPAAYGFDLLVVPPCLEVDDAVFRAWAEPLAAAGVSFDVVVRIDDRAHGVEATATEVGADLVVIAKDVRGAVHDVLARDLATSLVHLLPCPLLVIPTTCRRKRRDAHTAGNPPS